MRLSKVLAGNLLKKKKKRRRRRKKKKRFPREGTNILSYFDYYKQNLGQPPRVWSKGWQQTRTPTQWLRQKLNRAWQASEQQTGSYSTQPGIGEQSERLPLPLFCLAFTSLSLIPIEPTLKLFKEDWLLLLSASWQPSTTSSFIETRDWLQKRKPAGKEKEEKRRNRQQADNREATRKFYVGATGSTSASQTGQFLKGT